MLKKTLCAAWLLALVWGCARGQAADDGVVLVERGQTLSMTLDHLASVGVGDINVGYIVERRGDRFVIMGARAGETSLEVWQRGASKRVLKLRVVTRAAAKGAERAQAPAAPRPPSTTAASPAPHAEGPAAPAVNPSRTAAATTVVSVPPKPEAMNPDVARVEKRPGLLSPSRFEVTGETSFAVDTETYRTVDAEAVKAQAAEPVAGKRPAAERAATASALRANTVEVRRTSVSTPVTIRYVIDERSSVSLVLPFTKRVDRVKTGGQTFVTNTRGLGDLQLSFTRDYPRLRKTAWEGSLGFNVGLPTARSIYDAPAGKNPLGVGHFELGNTLGVRRVFDPLVFNASLGLSYLLPRTVDGQKVTPGLGQTLQTGFGYALNDRLVFSEQLYYARRPNYFLNTPTDDRVSSTEQAYLGHSLILNPKKSGGHTLRMSFNLGLTNSSTDYGLGLSYTYRRKRNPEQ
jgi:hypothetical protein